MKLRDVGEFGLIELIRKNTPRTRGVRLGIGDDAAWVSATHDSFLFTSDLLIEGVHFNRDWISMPELGHKSLTASLSDIAAMGGTPAYFLMSLALPDLTTQQVEGLYRGVHKLAKEYDAALVGGDTCAADRMVIDVFVAGYAPYGPVTRSGATVGDDIYVTGTLGDSALGLALLAETTDSGSARDRTHLIRRHCHPTARVKTGVQLAKGKIAKAMMDISDGLVQDLGHICEASGTGAILWQELLPLSPAFSRVARPRDVSLALAGGEDYELLFTAATQHRKAVERIAQRTGVRITRIGESVPKRRGLTLINQQGANIPLSEFGYDHFGTSSQPRRRPTRPKRIKTARSR